MTWRGRIRHGRKKQLAMSASLPDVSGGGLQVPPPLPPPPQPQLLSSPAKTTDVKYKSVDTFWSGVLIKDHGEGWQVILRFFLLFVLSFLSLAPSLPLLFLLLTFSVLLFPPFLSPSHLALMIHGRTMSTQAQDPSSTWTHPLPLLSLTMERVPSPPTAVVAPASLPSVTFLPTPYPSTFPTVAPTSAIGQSSFIPRPFPSQGTVAWEWDQAL